MWCPLISNLCKHAGDHSVTTEAAPHLTSLVWVCVVRRCKSSLVLVALCLQFISFNFMWNSLRPYTRNVIAKDNGSSPVRHQASIWTNIGLLYLDPQEQTSVTFESKLLSFNWKCIIWNRRRLTARLLSRPPRANKLIKLSLKIHNYVNRW